MLIATILIVIGVIVILWRIYLKKKNHLKPLELLPGPRGYPIVGNVMEFLFLPRKKRLDAFKKYFDTYGPVCRLYSGFLNVVHTSSVEDAQFILSSNTEIKKGYFYDLIKPWLYTGLLTSDGEKWQTRRKMLTPAFHYSILNLVCDIVGRSSVILLQKLEVEVNGEGFNIATYISSCTLDVICEAAMNVRMNSQQGFSEEYLKNVYLFDVGLLCGITRSITDRLANVFLYYDFIHRFSKNFRNQTKSLTVLHETSLKIIQQRIFERKEQKQIGNIEQSESINGKKKAFLDLLLDISDSTEGSLSTDDILEEVSTFMFEKTIFRELDSIFGSSSRLPDQNDLAQMKYLDCVFKEALRLYPSVPVISRRLLKATKIGNCVVPAGVDIAVHIHQLHRSPLYYKNPNKFDPSHFFPEEAQNRHTFAYIPFSAGPRNCVGQKFAKIELKIVLSQIFRYFEIKSLQKMEEMTEVMDLVLRPEFGVRIKIKKRNAPI